MSARPWPVELTFDAALRVLNIAFDDGRRFAIAYELLRVASPSAEVRGHNPAEAKLVAGKRNVSVTEAQPVGRYAVRIIFDDGHDSGLFSWDYLYELGRTSDKRMSDYANALHAAGLQREP